MQFTRRTRSASGSLPAAEPSATAPGGDWVPTWTMFLDQARWALGEQQKRSTGFATHAATILGFDGVMLALLAGSDLLRDGTSLTVWAARSAAVLVSASAVCTLGALWPRPVASKDWQLVVDEWDALHRADLPSTPPHQLFAHLLLVRNPHIAPEEKSRRGALRGPAQPLAAAASDADTRGNWVRWSGIALTLGVVALLIVVLGSPVASTLG